MLKLIATCYLINHSLNFFDRWKRQCHQWFCKPRCWMIVISVIPKRLLRDLKPSRYVILTQSWLEFHNLSFNNHRITRVNKSIIYWDVNAGVHQPFHHEICNVLVSVLWFLWIKSFLNFGDWFFSQLWNKFDCVVHWGFQFFVFTFFI